MRLGEKPESYILFYIFVFFFFFFYPNNTKEVNTNDFLCSFWSFVWWRIPVVQQYLFASPGCHWSNNPYRTVRHCALFFICINDRVTFFHRREKESFLHSLQSLMWPFAVMLVVKCGKKTGLSLFSKVRISKWCILNRAPPCSKYTFIWDIRQLETSTLLILYSAAGSFVSCVGWIWIYVTRVAAWALTQGDHLLQFWWTADASALLPMSERCLRLCRANCFSHQMAKTPVGSSSGCRIICIRTIILCINDTLAHQWQSRALSPHPPITSALVEAMGSFSICQQQMESSLLGIVTSFWPALA